MYNHEGTCSQHIALRQHQKLSNWDLYITDIINAHLVHDAAYYHFESTKITSNLHITRNADCFVTGPFDQVANTNYWLILFLILCDH